MSISKWPQHTTTDSQVNNCSMCALWTWTTASNRGRHWSSIRIRQQVRLFASEDIKLHCRSVLVIHRTELQDIPVNFSIFLELLLDPGLSYLHDCISVQLHALYSVPFWQSSAVHYRPSERSSSLCQNSNRTDCLLLVIKLFTNTFWTPSFFLTKEFNRRVIFVRERHVYQQTAT